MATFKGLFGRTLTGKAAKNHTARSIARAKKRREKDAAWARMQTNLAANEVQRQRQAVKDTLRGMEA